MSRSDKFIRKRSTYPSIEILYKLCEVFNVSADYLLGLSEEPRIIVEKKLDSFEAYLIDNFRRLNQRDKELLIKLSDVYVLFEE